VWKGGEKTNFPSLRSEEASFAGRRGRKEGGGKASSFTPTRKGRKKCQCKVPIHERKERKRFLILLQCVICKREEKRESGRSLEIIGKKGEEVDVSTSSTSKKAYHLQQPEKEKKGRGRSKLILPLLQGKEKDIEYIKKPKVNISILRVGKRKGGENPLISIPIHFAEVLVREGKGRRKRL